jgi:hypothetical protein
MNQAAMNGDTLLSGIPQELLLQIDEESICRFCRTSLETERMSFGILQSTPRFERPPIVG